MDWFSFSSEAEGAVVLVVVFTTSKAAPEERKGLVMSKIDNSKVLFASYKKAKKKKEKCLDPNLFFLFLFLLYTT